MCTGPRLTPLLLLLQLSSHLHTASSGTCWSAMVRNGRCTELLNEHSSKEECCASHGVATAWSGEHLDSGTLFFWRVLGGGVPCAPCKDSCAGVDCGKDKSCVVKNQRPRCVCSPKCGKNHSKGPVCGSDGRSYKNICRLKKRACRRNSNLLVAYNGLCQNSCDKIKCPRGKNCLVDQNLRAHCVKCARKCTATNPTRRKVCGADGVTYASACHLRQRACRKGAAVPLAYKGACRPSASCNKIRCKERQVCLKDVANGAPRCVTCLHRCKPRDLAGPICGTNNSTYSSWCHMIQDSCTKGQVIETSHSGKCVASDSPKFFDKTNKI